VDGGELVSYGQWGRMRFAGFQVRVRVRVRVQREWKFRGECSSRQMLRLSIKRKLCRRRALDTAVTVGVEAGAGRRVTRSFGVWFRRARALRCCPTSFLSIRTEHIVHDPVLPLFSTKHQTVCFTCSRLLDGNGRMLIFVERFCISYYF
jgi:hypothetical protein